MYQGLGDEPLARRGSDDPGAITGSHGSVCGALVRSVASWVYRQSVDLNRDIASGWAPGYGGPHTAADRRSKRASLIDRRV